MSQTTVSNIALAFDDVLLVPQYSDIKSRKEVDLSCDLGSDCKLTLPIISSCMDTVTEHEMALAMSAAGGIGIIHRYNTIDKQVELFLNSKKKAFCAIGVGEEAFERVARLYEVGCKMFCIDVAHGHHVLVRDSLTMLKGKYNDCHFMVGNVATFQGYDDLIEWGADSVRVGIGGGCFVPDTIVRTETGDKKIQEILIGDKVYSHDGTLKTVIDTMKFSRDEEIVSINGIECTKNHEFYVVEKKDADKITDENIHEYAKWIEAGYLDKEKYLLIEMEKE